jgi:anti-sigma B factor antagonist
MPFEVERTALDSGVTILALTGTMTMGNQLQELEWTVEELAKNAQNRIVFDMSRITYLDSSALGVLIGCHSTVQKSGGRLRIAGINDRVGAILKMTGVDTVLNFDATRDLSVAALKS